MQQATAFDELIEGARSMLSVERVYGKPYEQNGLTMIPAATVRGGGGGGEGKHGDEESGTGGGFGGTARPTGAWIIEGGTATWKPAVDVNRIVMGGQIVGLAAILVFGRILHTLLTRDLPEPELELPAAGRGRLRRLAPRLPRLRFRARIDT